MRAMVRRNALFAACALALGLGSGPAMSALVTNWGYETNAVFSSPVWYSGINTYTTATTSELSWGGNTDFRSAVQSGTPGTTWWLNNKSALTVGNFAKNPEELTGGGPAEGSVKTMVPGDNLTTPGVIGRGVSLTHWNNPIHTQWQSLQGATIIDTIKLTPQGGGASKDGPELQFVFKFLETPNDGGSDGRCEDGKSASSYGWNASTSTGGCPDIFAYQALDIVNQAFTYVDFTYFVTVLTLDQDGTVDAVGIPKLLDDQCTAVGLLAGCFGFVTAEGKQSTQRFGFAISAQPLNEGGEIPEPASLALLGLGLAGLAAVRRRRR